jgi:arylsulfatase A-like enzyme
LICAGSEIPKGMTSNEIVGLSDILPSILTPLGLEQPGIIGRPLPHTREESSSTQERFIVSANLDPPNSRRFSGIRTSSYKYFREEIKNEATEYLFDLNKDPRELNNIFSENDPTVASLRQTLNDELGGVPDNAFSPPLSKEEEKEIEGRLQALGYT